MDDKKDFRVITGILKVTIFIILIAGVFFMCAGRFDLTCGWIFFAISALNSGSMTVLIGKDLLEERSGFQKGAKKWDIVPALLVGRIGPLLILAVSGLDVRFDWTTEIPLYVRVIALIVIITGLLFSDWAVITNRFFSGVVRIQHDRGHVVISTGPYAYVRHPGYSGSILWGVATPLFLGSLWALSATIFYCIVIIFRTAMEDATLQRELNGYKDYTRQVYYRLFPGIW